MTTMVVMLLVTMYGIRVHESAGRLYSRIGFTRDESSRSEPVTEAVSKKIYFTEDELQTTEMFAIDKPQFCGTDKGVTLDLMVVVTSAVTHFRPDKQSETPGEPWR
ncbi:hypothetical protein HDE_10780 [Halotydeus destructor]|nr:hypothetical protein HDE_10780 [Halotydeus destructor]